MRVLHVLNELRPSGAESMLRLAAPYWQAAGCEPEVLSLGDDVGPYAAALGEAGMLIHHIPIRPVAPFLLQYSHLLRRGSYDIVHVHTERANFVLMVVASLFAGKRVIRTIHSVFGFRGKLQLERRIQRRILRYVGATHVAVSRSVRDAETRNFGNRTITIPNTYDDHRFRPPTPAERQIARQNLGIDGEEFVAAMVGNCGWVKNHDSVIRALSLPEMPTIRVLHAGFDADLEPGERELAERLGVANHVDFLGFVDDIPGLLHAADCFVMPSHYEGFGVAAAEAMACGLVPLLADVPGLWDFREDVPGIRWAQPQAASLGKALAQIARLSPDERLAGAAEASKAVATKFGLEKHSTSYLELYESVVRTPSARTALGASTSSRPRRRFGGRTNDPRQGAA
jgi:glycosyltransferase involved in cell wall biosynthesis